MAIDKRRVRTYHDGDEHQREHFHRRKSAIFRLLVPVEQAVNCVEDVRRTIRVDRLDLLFAETTSSLHEHADVDLVAVHETSDCRTARFPLFLPRRSYGFFSCCLVWRPHGRSGRRAPRTHCEWCCSLPTLGRGREPLSRVAVPWTNGATQR